MPTTKPSYSIILDDKTLEEIDDYRFDNRFTSRAKATSRLIRLGLEAYNNMTEAEKKAERTKAKEERDEEKAEKESAKSMEEE